MQQFSDKIRVQQSSDTIRVQQLPMVTKRLSLNETQNLLTARAKSLLQYTLQSNTTRLKYHGVTVTVT